MRERKYDICTVDLADICALCCVGFLSTGSCLSGLVPPLQHLLKHSADVSWQLSVSCSLDLYSFQAVQKLADVNKQTGILWAKGFRVFGCVTWVCLGTCSLLIYCCFGVVREATVNMPEVSVCFCFLSEISHTLFCMWWMNAVVYFIHFLCMSMIESHLLLFLVFTKASWKPCLG